MRKLYIFQVFCQELTGVCFPTLLCAFRHFPTLSGGFMPDKVRCGGMRREKPAITMREAYSGLTEVYAEYELEK